jgi:hypothetical protein
MTMTGSTSDSGKTWTYKGNASDAATGKDMPVQSKIIVADADHHTMEMWGPAPDGKVFKVMEINYTRRR